MAPPDSPFPPISSFGFVPNNLLHSYPDLGDLGVCSSQYQS